MSEVKKVIICIDDEKIILESLKSQLWESNRHEYIYEFAESAEEGQELVKSLVKDGIQSTV